LDVSKKKISDYTPQNRKEILQSFLEYLPATQRKSELEWFIVSYADNDNDLFHLASRITLTYGDIIT
jgi:hypothetical protein